jgi:hypothetical protein
MELQKNNESDQHDPSKNRIAVALSGSLVLRTYFAELIRRIEPSLQLRRHLEGQGY